MDARKIAEHEEISNSNVYSIPAPHALCYISATLAQVCMYHQTFEKPGMTITAHSLRLDLLAYGLEVFWKPAASYSSNQHGMPNSPPSDPPGFLPHKR